MNNSQLRLQLHEDHLRRIPDLQALARRLTRKKANLHDCYKIYQVSKALNKMRYTLWKALIILIKTQNSEKLIFLYYFIIMLRLSVRMMTD